MPLYDRPVNLVPEELGTFLTYRSTKPNECAVEQTCIMSDARELKVFMGTLG